MFVKEFYDGQTGTLTYLVVDSKTGDLIIIDPLLDFDSEKETYSESSAEKIYQYIQENNFNPKVILETHVHADHISGAKYFKEKYCIPVGISARVSEVREGFYFSQPDKEFFNLLIEQKEYSFGSLALKALSTPGHTPACMSFLIGNSLFVGDLLFLPDKGTGRCDFKGGSSEDLYESITQKVYSLPDETKIYVGHDYPEGREMAFQTTVAESKKAIL